MTSLPDRYSVYEAYPDGYRCCANQEDDSPYDPGDTRA